MKIMRIEPPKDTKYTVEISREELEVIQYCLLQHKNFYWGKDEFPVSPIWKNILKEIDRVL